MNVVRSGAEYQDTIAKAQQLSEEPLKAFDAGETLLPKQEDDLREAARLFKSMIGFTPSNMGSHTGLGKIWHALGDLPEAKKELTLAINFAPATTDEAIKLTLADAHASLSRVYFDMKQYKPAMDHGRVARSLAPKNPDYAVYQASAAIQLGFDDEAHKLIHEALDLDPYHERAQALDRFINKVHAKEASPSSPPSGAGKP